MDRVALITSTRARSSYGGQMDFGVVGIFALVMVGGFALGMCMSLLRPRDQEAAAMHRRQAGRALAWLPDRRRSKPDPGSG